MRLPRKIRHWLVFKLADAEFTTRSSFRNDERLYVIRQGCLTRLLDDVKLRGPDCKNRNCWQGINTWHDSECDWVKANKEVQK
jgi:hypothetical protein